MKLLKSVLFLVLTTSLSSVQLAQAGEIIFDNGDKLTGRILSQDVNGVLIDVDGIGQITVSPRVIKDAKTDLDLEKAAIEKKKADLYSGEVSAGFDRRRGNTDSTELVGELDLKRKTEIHEWRAKFRAYYSEEDKKMNAQKYYGLLRYDHRFFDDRLFFTFGSLEYDRDRFANIDGRYTPGAGVGYWIFDEDDYKLQVESKLGITHTQFRDETKDTTELVLVPRLYGEIKFLEDNTFSQEFTVYPSLTGGGEYRLYSETTLDAPLSKSISLKFQFIDEYNSMPGGSSKKNDARFISKIAYKI